ncbi:hypothetical protein NDU88_007322 [Pleurodeles waltl]|uniref:Uncharacterized protein n=1 Tax=Pleurodeles waltl TaxID=8319 RepID=A0AAV7N1S3_PLEWA|nr:hypothetical protein NDU88_007322 [Pleurodeles waltl]
MRGAPRIGTSESMDETMRESGGQWKRAALECSMTAGGMDPSLPFLGGSVQSSDLLVKEPRDPLEGYSGIGLENRISVEFAGSQ